MALTQIDDRGLKTPIDLLDNEKIRFGTGNDLEIFHNANNSLIKDTGTGNLILSSNQTQIVNAAETELCARFDEDGAVELYYNAVKKFETTSSGATLTGTLVSDGLTIGDSEYIHIGAAADLRIYHDGTDNRFDTYGVDIDLVNKNADGGVYELMLHAVPNGGVELYHNGAKKFETTATGVDVTGNCTITGDFRGNDGIKLKLGSSDDLQLYHDGSNSFIANTGGELFISASQVNIKSAAGEYMAYFTDDGASVLYYDDVKKFETASSGCIVSGDSLKLPDGSVGTPSLTWTDEGNADTGIYRPGANQIAFSSAGNACLQIDNGYTWTPTGMGLRVGTSSTVASELFTVQRTNAQVAYFDHVGSNDNYAVRIRHGRAASSTNATMMEFLNSSSTTVGYIASNGSATSYVESSDYRLKENEVSINDGITRVKALKPYKFNFKNNPSETRDGFFAHEVQSVVPQAINGEKDKVDSDGNPVYQGIDHSKLVPLLTAALKEAISEIETLKTKVAALEAA